ncbi:MlaD family protein [Paraburkholderia sp. CNPSo 3272]|uniref:PqiB family protein n=1 Tax=Paraburkholderia sp. CNPSo 3272 TaxID=2940931 RepID=UPI0020B7695F|nr:MlaD family protein [Paraburkholderia sp. CNPSo 3272]MCP3726801.1 MlaD family protein [Paraburkholderia sp. CNPSo 3272]
MANLAGGLMLAQALSQRSTRVTVSFVSGAGLVAGKTAVRYRGVVVGRLEHLHLSTDGERVDAELRLDAAGPHIAMCGTKFWVVRPRIDVKNISGLLSAVSGTWIDADIDVHSLRACHTFTGFDTPPAITSDEEGTRFVIRAPTLGSLNAGSPVYFRGVQVGEVLGYSLAPSGGSVRVGVFVRRPFDRLITSDTRWWQASGVELNIDSSGMRLDTPPAAALLAGGLAFDTPRGGVRAMSATSVEDFRLAESRTDAMRAHEGPPAVVRMRFAQSVQGLSVGAPVEFRGVGLGAVTAVAIDLQPESGRFDMLVTLSLYSSRLGRSYRDAFGDGAGMGGKSLLRQLVAQGLRGQLRTGSLLTGQKYVALDIFPHAPAARVDTDRSPVEMPTVPNSLEELEDQVSNIVRRLDRMPLQEIGRNLDASLQQSNVLFARLDTELVPAARSSLESAQEAFRSAHAMLDESSPLQSDTRQALAELRRTLASLNALADYLERHPEALIWGKRANP